MKNCLQFGALLQSTCHFIVTYPAGRPDLRLLNGDAFSVCGGNSCIPSASHYLFFSGGNCKFPIFSQPNCKFGRTREEMLSIVLKPKEHRKFTNAWRKEIGYKNDNRSITTINASEQKVINAAKEIYKDYPAILKALNLL